MNAFVFFNVSGKFIIPGTRKVATAHARVIARNLGEACASYAKGLTAELKKPFSGDFVRMNLNVERVAS